MSESMRRTPIRLSGSGAGGATPQSSVPVSSLAPKGRLVARPPSFPRWTVVAENL